MWDPFWSFWLTVIPPSIPLLRFARLHLAARALFSPDELRALEDRILGGGYPFCWIGIYSICYLKVVLLFWILVSVYESLLKWAPYFHRTITMNVIRI